MDGCFWRQYPSKSRKFLRETSEPDSVMWLNIQYSKNSSFDTLYCILIQKPKIKSIYKISLKYYLFIQEINDCESFQEL